MSVFEATPNLTQLREHAKRTQGEMAAKLGITQSQFSRYEQAPDDIPAGLYRRWLALLGQLAGEQGLEMADPRVEISERLTLMESYSGVEPQITEPVLLQNDHLSAKNFMAGVRVVARKPLIGVFGKFDSGKSRLLNVILGGNRLPTSYQPHTSIICRIRHVNDRPAWQAEDVWLFRKGFDLNRADDYDHCLEHKVVAGGVESLKQFGTHSGAGKDSGVQAAVLYLDAPVLLSTDLVDAPGFLTNEEDNDRAEIGHRIVDTIIFTSPINGFMDYREADLLGGVLRHLSISESEQVGPLGNLFLLSTYATIISAPAERDIVLDQASVRIAKHLEPILAERAERAGTPIGEAELRARMFTFAADDSNAREGFVQALTQHITADWPALTLKSLDQHIRAAKAEATGLCDRVITEMQTALTERESAQAEVLAIEAGEPERQRKMAMHEAKIVAMVDNYSQEGQETVRELFAARASVSAIENMIRNRYDDKKEARQSATSYLVNSIQQSVEAALKVRANRFAEEVDAFLGEFKPSVDPDSIQSSSFNFNGRAAFMSALTGMGTVGALAAWAAIAAAGSNLGGYILIAQIVGWLSSIGISLGGAGTVIAWVASIGGPVTLAIAAGIAVAIAAFNIFGDSWQTKLAKKIHSGLIEKKAQLQMQEAVAQYWSDTKRAFTEATRQTEQAYKQHVNRMRTLAFSTKREELDRALAQAKETRDFFAGMPWRAIS